MNYLAELVRLALFLPPQGSSLAREIDWLHFVVITCTLLGAFGIAASGGILCLRYRKRVDRDQTIRRRGVPAPLLWAELTVVLGLFGLFVAFWVVGYWQYVKIATPPADTYDVYVSGKQWMWKFAYPDGRHTTDTLYVPVNKPVRLILTSRDVIHSFFLPDFRVKHDVVPGRYTTLWFTAERPGTHRIFCAEYCGTWHSRMLGQVEVLSDVEFQRWLSEGEHERDFPLDPDMPLANAADSSLSTRGEQVAAAHGCLRCHTVDGSPYIGPTWAGLYQSRVPLEGAAPIDADVAYLTESMMDPLAKIRRGFAAVMPSYIGYLGPGDVGALVEYIKSLQHIAGGVRLAPAMPAGAASYVLPDTGPTPIAPPAGESGQPREQPKRTLPADARDQAPLPQPAPAATEQPQLQRPVPLQDGKQP